MSASREPAWWVPPFGSTLVKTTDLDVAVAGVTELMSTHTVEPTGRAKPTFNVRGFGTDGLAVLDMHYGAPVKVVADPLQGYLAVCLPVIGAMGVAHNGRQFEAAPGSAGFLGTPDSELMMDWGDDLRLIVVRVDLTGLRGLMARLVTDDDAPVDNLHFDPVMSGSGGATSAVFGQVLLLHGLLSGAGPEGLSPLVTARVHEQVLCSLLLGQPHTWSKDLTRRRERPSASAVTAAAEIFRTQAHEPLTVAGVARTVGLSVRALHAGFRRTFDTSPQQFLHRVRLERARLDLLETPPGSGVRVMDVAYSWGFSSPGRFAQDYRRAFGEPPSQTLQRIRSAHAADFA